MRNLVRALLSCLMLAGGAFAGETHDQFTLYLIRHAEKQAGGGADPDLTAAGRRRAAQLADWFEDKQLGEVWSSDTRRSRETVQPLLSRLGLEARLYDPRDPWSLIEKLQESRQTALVVGHSNTLPQLARLLCHCPVEEMRETEHDRLIVIAVSGLETRATSYRQAGLFSARR